MPNITSTSRKRILILGAGYGGVITSQGLSKLTNKFNLEVTLVNKHDYHQIITQLHEPASGHGYPDDIRIPLKDLISPNINFVKGVVANIDPQNKLVQIAYPEAQDDSTSDIDSLNYDYLVLALGSDPEYFDIPGMKEHSYPLRSLNAARMIKVHIENCLAKYKINPNDRGLLNFVVAGAGFTGIEMAGELAEWIPKIASNYDVPASKIRLICAEASSQVLPGFDVFISSTTEKILRNKRIELKLTTPIKEVGPDYVIVGGENIPTQTVIWTGGVRGNSLINKAGFKAERGRGSINQYLQSTDFEDVFIIGDSSLALNSIGKPLPPTAQLTIQQGQHLVKNFRRLLTGKSILPFIFDNKGVVASIGRYDAVGQIFGKYTLKGWKAIWMKKLVNARYLFIIGGLGLVLKKGFSRLFSRGQ